jgi:hypothetical protein
MSTCNTNWSARLETTHGEVQIYKSPILSEPFLHVWITSSSSTTGRDLGQPIGNNRRHPEILQLLLPNLGWSEILIRYHAVWLVDWISRHHDLWGRKRARMTGGGGDMSRRGSWRRHIGKLSRRKEIDKVCLGGVLDLDWLIAPMKRVRLCICLSWWSNGLELKENKSYGRDHTYVPFISRINVEASTVPLISKYKI